MLNRCVAGMVLLASLLVPNQSSLAKQEGPGLATTAATLTVLSGAVQRIMAGTGRVEGAVDGASLTAGDRIVTGPRGRALVTFLDGSTLTIEPESDIVIQQSDVGHSDGPTVVDIHINLGTVWARVVRLVGPTSSFTLESDAATAVVHEGLPGARQNPDGSFQCWIFDGDLTVTGNNGEGELALQPGQTGVVQNGQSVPARPIALARSTLRISTAASVLPLLQMPDHERVVGFVIPGIEVNQVFGSLTGEGDSRVIEVPAGEPGPYTLVLQATQDGTFPVTIATLLDGGTVSSQTIAAVLTKDAPLRTDISLQIDPTTLQSPQSAVAQGARTEPLVQLDGPLPGKVLLSPDELQAVAND